MSKDEQIFRRKKSKIKKINVIIILYIVIQNVRLVRVLFIVFRLICPAIVFYNLGTEIFVLKIDTTHCAHNIIFEFDYYFSF